MSIDTMIGREISGRYEVLSVLGRGGIGTVYKARQKHLDRLCALKILFEKHALEADNLARFEREARVSAGLQHENIVSVFDFGVAEEGFAFLVMELVLGENLETMIQTSGRLEPAAAIPLFLCITNALAYAHERSVMHRDLKPSNVMIARDENGNSQIKLVDFGLARSFCQDDSNLTSQGNVLGTPAYMSPEQCLGNPVDGRTDIYSLGILMFRALTGFMPFKAQSTFEAMNCHVNEPPRPVEEVAPHLILPDNLKQCLYKCLQKAPGDRYQNAMELRAGLEEALVSCWSQSAAAGTGIGTIIAGQFASDFSHDFSKDSHETTIEAARSGNMSAQFHLAMAYRDGDLEAPDHEDFLYWLRKAADAGHAEAQYELATCYDIGDYLAEDPVRAMHWYRKAAGQGIGSAMVNLGCLLEGGRGVEENLPEMLEWYRKAADCGLSLGASNYARCLYYGIGCEPNHPEAVRWLETAIRINPENDGAHYILGICYFNGDGVKQSYDRAASHYRAAAELGHPSACYELGLCHMYGEGVEKSAGEARMWLAKASETGNQLALDTLNNINQDRLLQSIDNESARSWLAEAGSSGFMGSVEQSRLESGLSRIVSGGSGLALRDLVADLKLCAERGEEMALLLMGKCYENGLGVPLDPGKALDLYMRAFDNGSELVESHIIGCLRACFEAGIYPERGLGWLLIVANRRDTRAMIALAAYYKSNNPEGRDLRECMRWYRRGAEFGDRECRFLLGRFMVMKNLQKRDRLGVIRWWSDPLEPDLDPAYIDDFDDEQYATDRQEALKWLHLAADDGSCEALRLLSALENRGIMFEKNKENAIKTLERAVALEDPPARAIMGVALLSASAGDSGSGSAKRGVELLEMAAASGEPFAQWNLALSLIEGEGCQPDRPRAKALLEASAEKAFPQDNFWSEDGFAGRMKRLVELFKDLSARGQKEAHHWLGLCYEHGRGIEKDRDRSLLLYLKAARLGYEPARLSFEKAPDNLKALAQRNYMREEQ